MPIPVFFNQQFPTLVDICARWQLVFDVDAPFELRFESDTLTLHKRDEPKLDGIVVDFVTGQLDVHCKQAHTEFARNAPEHKEWTRLCELIFDPFVKLFTVAIQLGAILAIALMYIKRFFRSLDIYFKLLAAFLPTAVVGLLAYDFISLEIFGKLKYTATYKHCSYS